MTQTLLVTGASGHLGRSVLGHLLDSLKVDPARIVAGSRKPDDLAAWAKRGVRTVRADFDDVASLDAAFAGVSRILLISTDSLDRPGRRLAQHKVAIDAAARARVPHVIYTSMPDPETSAVSFAPDHVGTEEALRQSGIPGFTLLRDNWYFENLLLAMPQVIASGKWYSAAGTGATAHIARNDIGRAAATALASPQSGHTTLTLTGARAYSTNEIARIVSERVARPIEVVPVTVDGLVAGLLQAGVPEPIARTLASFDANIAQGGLATVTGDFKALTGAEPVTFEAWVEANKAALIGA